MAERERPTLPVRALRFWRARGLPAFWFRALESLGYRRLHLFLVDMATPGSGKRWTELPVEYRFVERGDEADYRRLVEPAPGEGLADRLDQGQLCIGGWLEGELVAVLWEWAGEADVPYLQARVELAPDTVYASDFFVRQDVRRAGISNALLAARRSLLPERGYRWELSAVLPENPEYGHWGTAWPSFAGWIRAVKLGPFSHAWISFSKPMGTPPVRVALHEEGPRPATT